MERIGLAIATFFCVLVLMWLSFGLSAIVFSFFGIIIAKSADSKFLYQAPLLGVVAIVFFMVGLCTIVFFGSGFLRLFIGMFADLNGNEGQFTKKLLLDSFNFSKNVGISLLFGVFFGSIGFSKLNYLIVPSVYNLISSSTFIVLPISTYSLEFKLLPIIETIKNKLDIFVLSVLSIFDWSNWLHYLSVKLIASEGNILTFEPLFAGIFLIAGVLSFIVSRLPNNNNLVTSFDQRELYLAIKINFVIFTIFMFSGWFFFIGADLFYSMNVDGIGWTIIGVFVAILNLLCLPIFLISVLCFAALSFYPFIPGVFESVKSPDLK